MNNNILNGEVLKSERKKLLDATPLYKALVKVSEEQILRDKIFYENIQLIREIIKGEKRDYATIIQNDLGVLVNRHLKLLMEDLEFEQYGQNTCAILSYESEILNPRRIMQLKCYPLSENAIELAEYLTFVIDELFLKVPLESKFQLHDLVQEKHETLNFKWPTASEESRTNENDFLLPDGWNMKTLETAKVKLKDFVNQRRKRSETDSLLLNEEKLELYLLYTYYWSLGVSTDEEFDRYGTKRLIGIGVAKEKIELIEKLRQKFMQKPTHVNLTTVSISDDLSRQGLGSIGLFWCGEKPDIESITSIFHDLCFPYMNAIKKVEMQALLGQQIRGVIKHELGNVLNEINETLNEKNEHDATDLGYLRFQGKYGKLLIDKIGKKENENQVSLMELLKDLGAYIQKKKGVHNITNKVTMENVDYRYRVMFMEIVRNACAYCNKPEMEITVNPTEVKDRLNIKITSKIHSGFHTGRLKNALNGQGGHSGGLEMVQRLSKELGQKAEWQIDEIASDSYKVTFVNIPADV